MFHSSAQASCRLTARRRLALGGLVMTGALAAGAFVSTPAFADTVTTISSFGDLHNALVAGGTHLQLARDLDVSSTSTGFDSETVSASTSLDLNGHSLNMNAITVAHDVTFSVTDSTAAHGSAGTGSLQASADPNDPATAGTAVAGIGLGDAAELHVTDARVTALGTGGGAGIGSNDSSGTARVVASGAADVEARGSAGSSSQGGAGIGGDAGDAGIHVTLDGSAQVKAYGGGGGAGVGGGDQGVGGDVHIDGGELQATPGASAPGFTGTPASAVGSGATTGTPHFGNLAIGENGALALDSSTPLLLPSDAVVQNAGSLLLNPGAFSSDHAVQGTGTIQNTGAIDTHNTDGTFLDPAALIDSAVKITGNNYDLAVDLNGGSVQDYQGARVTVPATRHFLSRTLTDLLGGGYSVQPPSIASVFWKWTTGSGAVIDNALAAAGKSQDGTPVAVHLTAQFARVPVATATSLPDGTVGTAYSAQLPVSGDALNAYEVSYGNSSGSHVLGLPAGLSIDTATGVISGTPTEAVNRDVTFYVGGPVTGADLTYHFTVAPAAVVGTSQAPTITAVPKHTVKLGHELSVQLTASGAHPVRYALTSGALPKGITLNAASGLIKGSPSQSGTFSAVVTATNSAGSSSIPIVIVVPEVKDLISAGDHVPAVEVGAATVPLKVAGLKKGEHWTLKVDGEVVHRGTMKKAGTLSVTVHLKKALRDKVHHITIAGSRKVADPSSKASTTLTVTSLAARKTLKATSVAGQDGHKYVVIARLAAHEQVVVMEGSKVVVRGHASADGTFVFPQAKAGKGTSRLTVHGATAKRAGKLTVKNPKR